MGADWTGMDAHLYDNILSYATCMVPDRLL